MKIKTMVAALALVAGISMAVIHAAGCDAGTRAAQDPEGKYEAARVTMDSGTHYQVSETGGERRVILTTRAQYSTRNDVKVKAFSPDSTAFAAGYHYSHSGEYTWVGVWSLPDGKFVRSVHLDGWARSIPASVFSEKDD